MPLMFMPGMGVLMIGFDVFLMDMLMPGLRGAMGMGVLMLMVMRV